MRELNGQEVEQASGGLDWGEGGALVLSLSMGSLVVAGFGVPIGMAMLYIDYLESTSSS